MGVWLTRLEVTAGFLEDAPIEFEPGLNCVIGARGTCKSTIVETLRFQFKQDEERDLHLLGIDQSGRLIQYPPPQMRDLPGFGLIRGTLQPGMARAYLRENDEDREPGLIVERDTEYARAHRVFRNKVPLSGIEQVLKSIEIYSQGELHQIALDPRRRLSLVDRPNYLVVQGLLERIESSALGLVELGPQIRELRREIASRTAATSEMPALKERLSVLKSKHPQEKDDLSVEHENFLERQRGLEAARRIESTQEGFWNRLREASDEWSDSSRLLSQIPETDSDAVKAFGKAIGHLAELKEAAAKLIEEGCGIEIPLKEVEEHFASISKKYIELKEKQKERQVTLSEESSLDQEIGRMAKVVGELSATKERLGELLEKRDKIRSGVASLRSEIYEMRTREIETINDEFRDKIVLSLKTTPSSSEYRNLLEELLSGSNLRDQEGIAKDVSATFLPAEFIDHIENQESALVSKLLERDLAQINRMLAHLYDHPRLYSIESIITSDELDITMFDKGDPKSMNELSKGQMATALLPLIIRSDEYPLIIDQPEDDLDNSFIADYLVKLLVDKSSSRQIILITHNANIPVLGNAQRIIVMSMKSSTEAALPEVGSVDQQKGKIVGLLEGGQEAFDRRSERYSS